MAAPAGHDPSISMLEAGGGKIIPSQAGGANILEVKQALQATDLTDYVVPDDKKEEVVKTVIAAQALAKEQGIDPTEAGIKAGTTIELGGTSRDNRIAYCEEPGTIRATGHCDYELCKTDCIA